MYLVANVRGVVEDEASCCVCVRWRQSQRACRVITRAICSWRQRVGGWAPLDWTARRWQWPRLARSGGVEWWGNWAVSGRGCRVGMSGSGEIVTEMMTRVSTAAGHLPTADHFCWQTCTSIIKLTCSTACCMWTRNDYQFTCSAHVY